MLNWKSEVRMRLSGQLINKLPSAKHFDRSWNANTVFVALGFDT